MVLDGKVILVIGGNGLIGREIVKDIRKKGGICINADITLSTDLDAGEYKLDLTSPESIDIFIDAVFGKFGRIDGLVNSGYPRTKDWGTRFEEIPLESWRKNVEWQLNSCFYLCQKVLEIMRKQGYGSVVNFGSIYGVVGNDFTIYEGYGGTSPAAYPAIKGGIINFFSEKSIFNTGFPVDFLINATFADVIPFMIIASLLNESLFNIIFFFSTILL